MRGWKLIISVWFAFSLLYYNHLKDQAYQTIWGHPLPNVTRHSGWWPSTVTPFIDQVLHLFLTLILIGTLLPNLTFYRIARGFHRTFATGAACEQRTLTPLDTCSCSTFGLASVLMLRPISPELVLFPDFWVSNIPRYFFFAVSYCSSALPNVLPIYMPLPFLNRPEKFDVNAAFLSNPLVDSGKDITSHKGYLI